jgi:hypothetical protein
MRTDPLSTATAATHEVLRERLRATEADGPDSGDPRIHYAHTDLFLATASRRVAAVYEVLVPAVQGELPDSDERVHDLLHHARTLERTLATVKAKLYGEAHNLSRPWGEIWRDLEKELAPYLALETSLVDDLVSHLDEARCDELARHIHDAEQNAPSRPHPYTPHTGVKGKVARSIWAKADRLWDTAEGRIVPEPVHPHPKPPGLVAQYFLAEPQFDPEESEDTTPAEEDEHPT